ncbi:MAG: hypothetical protein U9Q81_17420 [Pseudomonadota bacterium]|nr:hypothetical protein [Pseudomonadota bacterium]
MDSPPTYFDYLREAFYRKARVPGLGGLPVNLMGLGAVAVLGIVNPGFWLLGAAAEIAYLTAMASSARFQKLVRGERLLELQQGWEQQMAQAVSRLSAEDADRYFTLLSQCRSIVGIAEETARTSLGNLPDLRGRHLNQLLAIFLRLLVSRQSIRENLRGLDAEALSGRIADLEVRLSRIDPEKEPSLARSLDGTLAIQRKRLENLDRAAANIRIIEAELDRIEHQVELMREETAVSGQPEQLSDRLDAISSSMNETARWLDRHADFFDGLSADEAAARAPDLPGPRRLEER